MSSFRKELAKAALQAPLWAAPLPLSTALFFKVFRGEGPLSWLLIHGGVTALLLFLAGRAGKLGKRALTLPLALAAVLSLGSFALIVLVQLNVTNQSLALSWLALARSGEAFGYFSFFAAQIWTLFLLPLPFLAGRRRHSAAILHALSAAALSIGLIQARLSLEILAIALAIPAWLYAAQGKPKRLTALPLPLAAAFLLSLAWLALSNAMPDKGGTRRRINFTPLVQAIAPHLPLLAEIPGYGFSISAEDMPRSVFLSERILFDLAGPPHTALYLGQERYRIWNGLEWGRGMEADTDIPVRPRMEGDIIHPSSIRLTLHEELVDRVPLIQDSETVLLAADRDIDGPSPAADVPLPGAEASQLRGLRFLQKARRGLLVIQQRSQTPDYGAAGLQAWAALQSKGQALPDDIAQLAGPLFGRGQKRFALPALPELENPAQAPTQPGKPGDPVKPEGQDKPDTAGTTDTAQDSKKEPQSRIPSEISKLVAGLGAPDPGRLTPNTVAFLRALLEHFASGYTYSLATDPVPAGRDPVGWFVEEGKKGYSIWFAAAFVLACQEAGFEARMAEGYLALLGESGQTRIRGYNAHAWPEVRVAGNWLRFEPTPPFAGEDPFAAMGTDRNTKDQLEGLFGPSGADEKRGAGFAWKRWKSLLLVVAGAVLAAGLAFLALGLLEGGMRRQQRRVRRLVAFYARSGVAHPRKTGWLAWEASVRHLDLKGRGDRDSASARELWEAYYRR